jgi:RNA polymerase sigma-70 factor, ECF subfamily
MEHNPLTLFSNDFLLGAGLDVAGMSSEKSSAEIRAEYADKTDAELVSALIKGNGESFTALVDRHMSMVYKFTYRYVGNVDATNDIVQEVFIKVWKNIKRFDQGRNFKTWLLTIAKNTALDSIKKKKSVLFSKIEEGENDLDAFLAPYVDTPDLPDQIMERQYAKAGLDAALAQLNPSYRSVLLLRYTEHMKFREIAHTLQEPIDTIKSKHRRALILLKKLLTASAPAGGAD